jgi:hypothetical protein
VVIVPEKFSVYPEYLPDHVRPVSPDAPLDRIVAALARHTRSSASWTWRPALRTAKPRGRLYYKSDSHWTVTGALVGYEGLAPALAAALPGWAPAPPPPLERYTVPAHRHSGDLARMLGLPREFRERDTAAARPDARRRDVALRPPPGGSGRGRPLPSSDRTAACTPGARPGLPRALVVLRLADLPPHPRCSRTDSPAWCTRCERPMELRQIDHERPDIVIEEMVERALYLPAEQPLR